MRLAVLLVLVVGVAALVGCGGGGTGTGTAGATTAPLVAGTVTLRDGSAGDLSGILVECVESGDTDVTDGNGSFEVDAEAGGTLRIRFDDPGAIGADSPDCPEGDDPDGDDADVDGDEIELEGMDDGETCEIEVVLENGEVVECHVGRDEDEDGEIERRHGEGRLHPPEGSDLDAHGEIEVGIFERCSWIEVEVEGRFGDRRLLDVFLQNADGVTERIGRIELHEGHGHMAIEDCVGDDRHLPFGAESAADLAGYRVLVEDLDGHVLLVGEVPGTSTDEVDRPDGDGDHEDGEHHEDGEEHHDGEHHDGDDMH